MSDTNNNIPTRITQLEEATEYEDGMFYAVAKAGRGTYKIPVDEMTPNEQALSDKMENEIVPAVENSFAYGTVENQSIATFTDGSALSMPKLEIAVEPQQEGSGDPSPENIRPISGWSAVDVSVSGVNVWDEEWEIGYIDGGNGQPTVESTSIRSKNFNSCVPNTNYYGSAPATSASSAYYIYWYDAEKNYISRNNIGNTTIMSPSSAVYFKLACYHYGSTYNHDISINYPSTDTSYHAYNGSTITIQLGDTYYGGKLDVVSGVLTVDRAYVDLGTLDWQYSSIAEKFYASATALGVKATDVSTPFNAISSALIAKSYNEIDAKTVDYAIGINPNATQFFARYSSITSASDFITAMNGVQLVYELATPTTIQLTPTQVKSLKGYNNISANTGNILKVEYIRDLDIVINSLLERIAALEG